MLHVLKMKLKNRSTKSISCHCIICFTCGYNINTHILKCWKNPTLQNV